MAYDDAQAWKDVSEHFPDMTIYYIFLLKKGPPWRPEETPEIAALQEAHLANLRRLGEMGKLVINGPLLDSFATSGETPALPGTCAQGKCAPGASVRCVGVLKTGSVAKHKN